ncbi:MAG: DUF3307 domain-containing protein [Oscillospiraceae bacterium]|nr:DUF3307 domain-containing protein [Oscillospiraceae bacterium]
MTYLKLTILLGYLLAEFYLQRDRMIEHKYQRFHLLLIHLLIYCAVSTVVLTVAFRLNHQLLMILLFLSISHILIDLVLWIFVRCKSERSFFKHIRRYRYFINQLLLLASFLSVIIVCDEAMLIVRFKLLESHTTAIILCIAYLLILRPISITINEFFTATGLSAVIAGNSLKSGEFVAAGNIIGMLERSLVFILILFDQYAAIGFLMTAKTITRFKDLEDRNIAEYYLIGTLLSIVSVVAIALLSKQFL